MQVPEWFESNKTRRLNVGLLRDVTKEEPLARGEQPISEDLLLRSLRETQMNMLPYLTMMGWEPAVKTKLAFFNRNMYPKGQITLG